MNFKESVPEFKKNSEERNILQSKNISKLSRYNSLVKELDPINEELDHDEMIMKVNKP